MDSRIRPVAACLLVAAMAACGCGSAADPLGRQSVSGEVYLHGQPIDKGAIQFAPTDTTAGVSSGALIANGVYSIPAEKGLPPGTYIVRISAPEGEIHSDEAGDSVDAVAIERVPPEYNSQSEQTVEVKAGVENRFDFRIE